MKELFLKLAKDGRYGICVDRISGLIRIRYDHDICPVEFFLWINDENKIVNEWKQEGECSDEHGKLLPNCLEVRFGSAVKGEFQCFDTEGSSTVKVLIV